MNENNLDIPVTTLAGLTSISDLLSELPLSDTLPSQQNKSLLFHPRVAEEANNVLSQRDDVLAQQLISAIEQTNSNHIEIKPEYCKDESSTIEAPLMLKLIQSSRPNVFNSNVYNQKYVNPIASSHFENAQQQNLTQNYSLHPNPMQLNHYDASFNSTTTTTTNNFNNFDPSNQFQYHQHQTSSSSSSSSQYQAGGHMQPQQQQNMYQQNTTTTTSPNQQQQNYYGQSMVPQPNQTMNNGPSTYQHTIDDLLVHQPTTNYQQTNLYNSQEHIPAIQTHQSSYNIAQLLDTNTTTSTNSLNHQDQQQQQNLTGFYQQNSNSSNLQQQQMTSSVCTSSQQQQQITSNNSNQQQTFSTINTSQLEQTVKMDQQNHYISGNNHTSQQSQTMTKNAEINQIPQSKNNHIAPSIQQQQQQFNNNMHLRSTKTNNNNDVTHQKTAPRNNEYLEQQQQQRPSPAQGSTAPDTNHLNIVQQQPKCENESLKETNSITQPEAATTSHEIKIEALPSSTTKQPTLMETFDISDADAMNFKQLIIPLSKVKVTAEEKQQVLASLEDLNSSDLFSKMKEDDKRAPLKRKVPFPEEDVMETFNQPKLRRIEKKLAPVTTKMSTEELMKTNTYIRFNNYMEKIFEQLDETEIISYDESDDNPECITPSLLASISAEAAKLKARASIDAIPEEKLTLLINYAMRSVHSAKNFSAGPDSADDLVAEDCLDKILNAIEAALLVCNIYTSKDTKFLQEDNIDAIIKFVQFQLRETIFPSYDPVYTIETKKKAEKAQNKKKQSNQQKGITMLYTKIVELTKLFVRLFNKFHFVDTIIIHASSLGVEPFFVDNIETLQFVCLDLVTSIFQNEKYKHHRHNILNDILSSVDRLPHSKRNLRPYKLMNNAGCIQMMTALVLQLIQCSVLLPDEIYDDEKISRKKNSESKGKIDQDSFMLEKYKTATSIGGNFIQTFLNKCKSRSTETDFRPLFENFIQDLLTTVNKPEWPASELLLTLLGTVLVKYMSDKSVDQSIRVASLEYLGLVAARLRKDTVKSRNRVKTMDELIKCIKIEQEKDGEDDLDSDSMIEIDPEEERTEFLQRILLDYLLLNSQEENPVWNHSRHFYLTLWYYDIHRRKKEIADGAKGYASRKKTKKTNNRKKHRNSDDSDESSDSDVQEVRDIDPELNREIFKVLDQRKKYLLSKVAPFKKTTRDIIDLKTYLDYDNANLIAQYLASKRRFSQSFDIYLKKIILVVREPVVAIRTRAMKCLGNIVEVDQSILARKDMQIGVAQKLLDAAISVREAAVDLVGKYILTDRTLVDQYYEMISPRILDTGVSVRKRVIKILRDICGEFPDHPKIPDICIKMLRRVNDEENIQKLVMEVFMTMWFTPCNNNDKESIRRKCDQIIDVELSSQEKAFHGLLKTVFEPKEVKDDSKGRKEISQVLIRACQQIVDGLVSLIMEYEKSNITRLVGCVTALHSFSQIRPQLIVAHAISLEPYLNIKCTSNEQIKFLALLAEILEQVVPLMEHPGDAFLSDLEAHLMTLIVTQRQMVVHSCVACLGAVINKMTKNYPLIRECFAKVYTRALVYTKERMIRDPNLPSEQIYTPVFRRGIFTVGLLMRFFDFSRVDVNGSNTNERNRLSPNICDEIFETLLYFLNSNIQPIQREILQALGYFCVTNCEYLTRPELREYYNHLLSILSDQNELKIMVLKNILLYLMEEEIKMTKNDKEWNQVQSKTEDLKEMCDISSGMSSRVIQIYLKEILNSFLNGDFSVRLMAMRVVEIVLRQGLVHPVQIVPYLICLSTDPETEASHSADRHLQEIDKQYQGFVNMKCQQGVQLSYHLQSIIQKKTNGRAVRGYRLPKAGLDEPPSALNGFVYSLLRNTKPNRRALVGSMTKQFDDEKSTLSFMLYLADNLAYFPYVVQDEPLYLIHQIDLFISVTGTNLLQNFRDGLKPKPGEENKEKDNPLEDEDDEEDRDALYERLPDNTTDLQQCITSAQGCMLLLILKQHLKDMYGINDAKIAQYSPSESTKIYDKAMQRRHIQPFNPKATIAILKEDPKAGDELNESQKRVLVDRYLEFKQLMIKLDPDEEDEEDDDNKPLVKQSMKNQAVTSENLNANGNSSTLMNDSVVNNVHLNNVQINLTRVNLPPEYQNFEKAINVNSIPKPQTQKPSKAKSTPSKKSSSKKKRRKLSSSEEDEESDFDDDDYD